MMRVSPAPEPPHFDAVVRKPGLRALAEMVGENSERSAGRRFNVVATHREHIPAEKFPTYWTEVIKDLKTSYNHICAYSCFRIHPVTGAASVDHLIAKSKAWDRVYEWNNYRLACSRMNSRKNDFNDVLDPFEIDDQWFCLELVGFQVVPNPEIVDIALRASIQATIDRLRLDDFRKDREADAEAYWGRDVSLRRLEKESPFVARELRRQGKLNPEDV